MKRFLVVLIASVMFVTFVGFAIAEETEFDMSTLKWEYPLTHTTVHPRFAKRIS